ncbi:SMI1/KNR4 family protein [Acinetobacter guillouiae]|uniref:Knr4/Smi1-like domain-containing protein n=1 Tax=Acinetobacter guillouiae NIPH 991 TaxID=1217656 RepID=N8Y9Y6_ACIGI|nr:SMI1/KNR4 family protein [Acinetobacter guillouiae]ENV18064.1 hypothetical protein F964_01383 [Acinetobacter guillouiae NIPH 991]
MNEQLQKIQQKLEQLKALDIHCTLFGANRHQYRLNPCLSLDVIEQFESSYQIQLPKDYVAFLTQLGNGGAGPYYGIEPFEKVLFTDLDYPNNDNLLHPNLAFPHTQPWNEFFEPTCDEEDEEEYERQYSEFHQHQMDGVLAICNYGCGVSLNLVVNGAECGHIWIDDRANDGGIYPSHEFGNTDRIPFLDWYELWLDLSLEEIAEKIHQENMDKNQQNNSEVEQNQQEIPQQQFTQAETQSRKAWWKFW